MLTYTTSVYNTWGTITRNSNHSRLDNINYGLADVTTGEELIRKTGVLDVAQVALVNLDGEPGSSNANSSLYLEISQHANKHVCSDSSDISGAVMMHGSNTLEETVCRSSREVTSGWLLTTRRSLVSTSPLTAVNLLWPQAPSGRTITSRPTDP